MVLLWTGNDWSMGLASRDEAAFAKVTLAMHRTHPTCWRLVVLILAYGNDQCFVCGRGNLSRLPRSGGTSSHLGSYAAGSLYYSWDAMANTTDG